MRWTTGRRSENTEDRRGLPVSLGAAGGGIGIILLLLALFLHIDPRVVLQGDGPALGPAPTETPIASPATDPVRDFVSVGRVSPESFTHGTSAQRVQCFKRAFLSGDMNQCDTFRRVGRADGTGSGASGPRSGF